MEYTKSVVLCLFVYFFYKTGMGSSWMIARIAAAVRFNLRQIIIISGI